MNSPARVRAEWCLCTLEVQAEELLARLGPRKSWFELRCYVWSFDHFRKLLAELKLEPTTKKLESLGFRTFEDATLNAGQVELRLVPKAGRPR